MMRLLKRMLIGILVSLGGVGTASITGLPGVTGVGERTEEVKAAWVDWGGSHLNYPEILQSQEAVELEDPEEAYGLLALAQENIDLEDPYFDLQLLNNLAASAYSCRLHQESMQYIQAAENLLDELGEYIEELSDAVFHNRNLIGSGE